MRPYRTLLEQKIRERRMTLEEFCTYAENFAREHGEPGTLSLRHLQRLVAGKGPKGQPLGPIRPATARLLERIFEMDSIKLLALPMQAVVTGDDDSEELRERIEKARRVDTEMVQGLRSQLNTIRRIDRQYGATITYGELSSKISQAQYLLTYSFTGNIRKRLAILLSEMHALAGWQSLDMGHFTASWRHYEKAKVAAIESEDASCHSHAAAQQAFTLIDLGATTKAVELVEFAVRIAERGSPTLLQVWLTAAYGEALAAHGRIADSLQQFDEAERLLPGENIGDEGPYVILDSNHLARWRGHSTASSCRPGSVSQLNRVLLEFDSTFARAESTLRVDIGRVQLALGGSECALEQFNLAKQIAQDIGSVRQLKRIRTLRAESGMRIRQIS